MSAAADSTPARRAYEAYRETVGGVAVNGDPLPDWDALGGKVQEGWRSAAGEGWSAHDAQNRAERRGAAEQKVFREGAVGPSAKIAKAFMDSVDRLAGPGVPWSATDSPANLQVIFADLMRGGHLQPGRATRVVGDRNKNYIPPGLDVDRDHGRSCEISGPSTWWDLEAAENLLRGAYEVLSQAGGADPRVEEGLPHWFAFQNAASRWVTALHEAEKRNHPARMVRVELAGADELNGGEAGSWWWADVSGDGTHWARFRGHMVQIDIELHTANYREVNDWKGRDEVRPAGSWTLKLNRQPLAEGHVGDEPLRALETIKRRADQLIGHVALNHDNRDSYRDQLMYRRVYFERTPAVVVNTCLDQGCVILRPVGSPTFPISLYDFDRPDDSIDDPYERTTAKVELWHGGIHWWRDRLVEGEPADPEAWATLVERERATEEEARRVARVEKQRARQAEEAEILAPGLTERSGEAVPIEVEDDDTTDDAPEGEEAGGGESSGRWRHLGTMTNGGEAYWAPEHDEPAGAAHLDFAEDAARRAREPEGPTDG